MHISIALIHNIAILLQLFHDTSRTVLCGTGVPCM